MRPATLRVLRARLPALGFAALLHAVFIALLLQAMPKLTAPDKRETETSIFLPEPEPEPLPKAESRAPAQHGASVLAPYFNPRLYSPDALWQPPGLQRLGLVLAACDPSNYDKQPDEVRSACARIGMIVAADPEHFGVKLDYMNGKRWDHELLIKQTPLLLPCMSPTANPFEVLFCVANVLMKGYDPDKMPHYEK
jgi:hypothetical protein